MRWMIDLNVVLDVIQEREPFHAASAQVLSEVVAGRVEGCLAAHALTTLHYIVARHVSRERADEAVDWALRHFVLVPQDREVFLRARILAMADFEDAALAAAAEKVGCDSIVTRNVGDFAGSPIPAVTPEELLALSEHGSVHEP